MSGSFLVHYRNMHSMQMPIHFNIQYVKYATNLLPPNPLNFPHTLLFSFLQNFTNMFKYCQTSDEIIGWNRIFSTKLQTETVSKFVPRKIDPKLNNRYKFIHITSGKSDQGYLLLTI